MLCNLFLIIALLAQCQIGYTFSTFDSPVDAFSPFSPQVAYLPKHCGTYESDCEKDSMGLYSTTIIVFNGTESGNPYSTTMETRFYDDDHCSKTQVATQRERYVIDTIRDHRKYRLVPKESTIRFHSPSLLFDRCASYNVQLNKDYYISSIRCLSELISQPTVILTSFQPYYLDIISADDFSWKEYYPVATSGCIEDDKTYCGTYQRCEKDLNFSFLHTTRITGSFGKTPVDVRYDKDEHLGVNCNNSTIMRSYAFNVTPATGVDEYIYTLHHVYIRVTGDWWKTSWNCEPAIISKHEYDIWELNCTKLMTGEDAFAYLKGRIGTQGRITMHYTNSTLTHYWDGFKALMDWKNWDGCTFYYCLLQN